MSMLKINEEDIYEGIDDVTVPTWPLCDTLYILPYFNDQVLSLNLRRDALSSGVTPVVWIRGLLLVVLLKSGAFGGSELYKSCTQRFTQVLSQCPALGHARRGQQ